MVLKGNWFDGQVHGKGEVTWSDGSVVEGDYVDGVYQSADRNPCVWYIRLLASCPMGTPPKRIAGRGRLANMCLVEFLSAAHFFKLNKSLIQ